MPSTGQEGSYPPFALITGPQSELVNLLDWAGLTPSDGDMNQVTRAVRGGQLDFDATDTGTADAIVCQVGLPHTQIAAGLPFTFVKGPSANTGAFAPTLTITDLQGNNGLTGAIFKATGGALAKGDLPANALITVRARAPGVFAVVSMVLISDVLALIYANTVRSVVGNPTVYVDCNAGLDTNPGTAAAPFKTINGALAAAALTLNLTGKTLGIVLAVSGTYSGPVNAVPGIAASVAPAANVTATISGFGCLAATGGGSLSITGAITLYNLVTNTSGGAVATVTAASGGSITLGNGITLSGQGQYTVGAHLSTLPGGNITIAGGAAITVSSGFNNFMSAVGGCITWNGGTTLVIANNTGFPVFAFAQGSGGNISMYSGSTTINYTGSSGTGQRYAANNNASIQTNGGGAGFFPGNSAGTMSGNGTYT